MPVATATTSTTTAPLLALTMSLSSTPETAATSFHDAVDTPEAGMQPFALGQCLFCPDLSPNFTDSVIHMKKSHGLFISHQQNLVVDLETLFNYLHLVIFGYRECIQCGTERATVQAVQQHMTGKGHCRFDILEQDSEFADFYSFSEPEDDSESDVEDDSDEGNQKASKTSPRLKPQLADEDWIRLPSGKIISRHSSAQSKPSLSQLRRRVRALASQPECSLVEIDGNRSSKEEFDSDIRDTRLLSKKEKRKRTRVDFQLADISRTDRNGLMHLHTSQQRSLLATQHRLAEKVQKEERRRQGRIDRKGNKNLYAYWSTETPIYQCG